MANIRSGRPSLTLGQGAQIRSGRPALTVQPVMPQIRSGRPKLTVQADAPILRSGRPALTVQPVMPQIRSGVPKLTLGIGTPAIRSGVPKLTLGQPAPVIRSGRPTLSLGVPATVAGWARFARQRLSADGTTWQTVPTGYRLVAGAWKPTTAYRLSTVTPIQPGRIRSGRPKITIVPAPPAPPQIRSGRPKVTLGTGAAPVIRSGRPLLTVNPIDVSSARLRSGRPMLTITPTPADQPRGALPIGTAAYTAPAGAYYVDPVAGSDSNDGLTAPWATFAKAVTAAPSGAYVCLRGGTYFEAVSNPSGSKSLTIAAAPGENVQFDGSQVVTAWTAGSGVWTTPYPYNFDHTSGFNTGTNSIPPNANSPLAAYPDQVFIDGVAQTQVSGTPTAGQFAVDTTNQILTLGSNPAGHTVQVSVLQRAILWGSTGYLNLYGIMFRKYATSLPQYGSVYYGSRVGISIIENCHFIESATQGLSVTTSNPVFVNHCTGSFNGMTGMHVNICPIVVTNSRMEGNNTQNFPSVAAAGIKITNSTAFTISSNDVIGNKSNGIWTDTLCLGGKITNNTVQNNYSAPFAQGWRGIMCERSDSMIIAGNNVSGSRILVETLVCGRSRIYNNTFGAVNATVVTSGADPLACEVSVRRDGRNGNGTTAVPCYTTNVSVVNNVFTSVPTLNGSADKQFNIVVYDSANTGTDPATICSEIEGNVIPGGGNGNVIRWGSSTYQTMTAFNNATAYTWKNPTAGDVTAAVELPLDICAALSLPSRTKVQGIATGSYVRPVVARPTGAGYVRYEDLYVAGDTLQAVVNRVTGGQVLTLPEGIFEFAAFANGYYDGLRIGSGGATGCGGIVGSGIFTVLRMTPNTATSDQQTQGAVTSGTNNLNLICFAHVDGAEFGNLTLQGTEQGTNYNGVNFQYLATPNIHDLYLQGASVGSGNVPPPETFGGNLYKVTGTFTIANIEIDGRNAFSNVKTAASLLGLNNCTSVATCNDSYLHDTGHSHGFALYYSDNFTSNRCTLTGFGTGTGSDAGVALNCEESNNSVHNNVTVGWSSLSEARYHSNSDVGDTTGHQINGLTILDGGQFDVAIDGTQVTRPTMTNAPAPVYNTR